MIAKQGFYKKMNKDEELKYLAIKLAPTIFGVKPSVLLTLKDIPGRMEASNLYTFYMQNKQYIRRVLNVEFFELKNCGYCAKVMFFKKYLIREAVCNKLAKEYLGGFGYSNCHVLDDYLQVLKKRFNSGNFPHEIGVFLGYPLKDVIGFVKCHKKCRNVRKTPWKVYGNPETSLQIIKKHNEARNSMQQIIDEVAEFHDLRLKLLPHHTSIFT
jgi:hypothetical protein